MHFFFYKFITKILPNIKLFEGIKIKNENAFSFSLYDLLIFPELEIQYDLFQKIPKLDISIVTTTNYFKESKVLFTGSQFFIK
jgi:ribosomal protein L5